MSNPMKTMEEYLNILEIPFIKDISFRLGDGSGARSTCCVGMMTRSDPQNHINVSWMGWLTCTSALRRQRGEVSQINELWDQLREPASRNKAKSGQGRLPRSSLILRVWVLMRTRAQAGAHTNTA